jgi:hypothetical protein
MASEKQAANENKDLQINPTPYEEAVMDQSWKKISKELSKPDLKPITRHTHRQIYESDD